MVNDNCFYGHAYLITSPALGLLHYKLINYFCVAKMYTLLFLHGYFIRSFVTSPNISMLAGGKKEGSKNRASGFYFTAGKLLILHGQQNLVS